MTIIPKLSIQKTQDLIMKTGSERVAARAAISGFMKYNWGIGLADLPDTHEICEIVDELQGVFAMQPTSEWQQSFAEIVGEIDDAFMESLVMY